MDCAYEAIPDTPAGTLLVEKDLKITVDTEGREHVMTLEEAKPGDIPKASNSLGLLITGGKDGKFTLTAEYAVTRIPGAR